MRLRISTLLAICLVASVAFGGRIIKKGSVDQWATIHITDSTTGAPELAVDPNTPGLDLEYFRIGAVAVDLTEVANADPNTHSDGGLYNVGHGYYLVGLPDAAVATGADFVNVQGTATGMIVDGDSIQLTTADLQTALATSTAPLSWPVSQTPIPKGRTWKLQHTSSGLVGLAVRMQIGEAKVFAVDFSKDLAPNTRVTAVIAVTIKTGTAGGVTFNSAFEGVDHSLAKLHITGVTAGTYVINVRVTYSDTSTAEADITLAVVA